MDGSLTLGSVAPSRAGLGDVLPSHLTQPPGSAYPLVKGHPPMSTAVYSQDGTLLGWRSSTQFVSVSRYWPEPERQAAGKKALSGLLGEDFMRRLGR